MTGSPTTPPRWVCLDVGETLIDETRIWSTWADVLGIPRMTFLAAFGAVVARGEEHQGVFSLLGIPDWRARSPEVQARYGGFQPDDLYPDVLPAIAALRDRGLRALGVDPDVMAMSDEMGIAKPDARFFVRALELMGGPAASAVAYVGDRPDNDVRPSAAAGMRAVWLRRGPWGVIAPDAPGAVLQAASLTELVSRLDEAWDPSAVAAPTGVQPLLA